MSRTLLATMLLSLPLAVHEARAQEPKPAPSPATAPKTQSQVTEPPEEDPGYKERTFEFNPLKATKSIEAGNFYYKKGNYAAAKGRYTDATLYDPGSPQAFLKLGEADEKLHEFGEARDAFTKYLKLDPTAKEAESIKKRMEKWPGSSSAQK